MTKQAYTEVAAAGYSLAFTKVDFWLLPAVTAVRNLTD